MKVKHIVCAFLMLGVLHTVSYAANDSLKALSDTRITDAYSGLVYGTISSDIMQSSDNVSMDGNIGINTEDEVSVNTREDVLDAVAAEISGNAAKFNVQMNIDKCTTLTLEAKLSETNTETLWQGSELSGEVELSVITKAGKVYTMVNGVSVGETEASRLPSLELTANSANMTITSAYYGQSNFDPGETEMLSKVNGATAETIVSSITECANYFGFDTSLYSCIPLCDKNIVGAKIMESIPYANKDTLESAYEKAIKDALSINTDEYGILWTENFSNYSTDNWTETGMSFRGNQIGTGYMSGIGDQERKTLNIDGEDYSAGFVGASLAEGNANYIKRAISNSNSIVTAYFYDNMNDNGNPRYKIQINDTTWVGRTDGSGKFSYVMDGNIALTDVNVESGWHKVVFDGLTNPGTVTVYLDGTQIGQTAQPIEYLQLGNGWSDSGFDIVWMDNISVAVQKSQTDWLEWLRKGEGTINEDVMNSLFNYMNKDYSLFESLPACDRSEIVNQLDTFKPYSDFGAFEEVYQTILENTTRVDRNLYKEEFVEDFSNLDAGWTQSQNPTYVGDGNILGHRKYLNISGNETSFMGVWGPNLGAFGANGGNQYITRTLNDPYCIVSGYMYYSNIDGNPKAYYGIEGQNNSYWIGTGGGDGAYRYKNGTSWVNNIAANDNAWHKIVFDGLTEPGKIKAYFDGKLQFTAEDTMAELKVGCLDPNANGGFYIVCFDNISVASAKDSAEEKVTVTSGGVEYTDTLPDADTVTVQIENPAYDKDYIAASYKDGVLVQCKILRKNELLTTSSAEISISGANRLKVFAWNSVEAMTPAAGVTELNK